MNGRPWTEADTATLRQYAGKESYAEIGRRTGHPPRTVRAYANAMGLPAYVPGVQRMTRREMLLHSAAGLDFQMTGCPI